MCSRIVLLLAATIVAGMAAQTTVGAAGVEHPKATQSRTFWQLLMMRFFQLCEKVVDRDALCTAEKDRIRELYMSNLKAPIKIVSHQIATPYYRTYSKMAKVAQKATGLFTSIFSFGQKKVQEEMGTCKKEEEEVTNDSPIIKNWFTMLSEYIKSCATNVASGNLRIYNFQDLHFKYTTEPQIESAWSDFLTNLRAQIPDLDEDADLVARNNGGLMTVSPYPIVGEVQRWPKAEFNPEKYDQELENGMIVTRLQVNRASRVIMVNCSFRHSSQRIKAFKWLVELLAKPRPGFDSYKHAEDTIFLAGNFGHDVGTANGVMDMMSLMEHTDEMLKAKVAPNGEMEAFQIIDPAQHFHILSKNAFSLNSYPFIATHYEKEDDTERCTANIFKFSKEFDDYTMPPNTVVSSEPFVTSSLGLDLMVPLSKDPSNTQKAKELKQFKRLPFNAIVLETKIQVHPDKFKKWMGEIERQQQTEETSKKLAELEGQAE